MVSAFFMLPLERVSLQNLRRRPAARIDPRIHPSRPARRGESPATCGSESHGRCSPVLLTVNSRPGRRNRVLEAIPGTEAVRSVTA
jgi:hypothetical protein